jgi:DNA-binding NarL/FixJ family response regulator
MSEHYKLLIADDNVRARLGLRALLALQPEIEVVGEATDGNEAVRWVQDSRPDVVLMDARMPQMDGLEATRQIKAHWPQIRVIVLTIHTALRVEALAAGADVFLVKGCPAGELLAAIMEC